MTSDIEDDWSADLDDEVIAMLMPIWMAVHGGDRRRNA